MIKEEDYKMKKYHITYQRMRVRIPYPRPIRIGTCLACKRSILKGEIKVTQMHHTKLAYKKKQVKENPILALHNTLELCFGCHQPADGFRAILVIGSSAKLRSTNSILRVAKLLPLEQLDSLELFCWKFLEWKKQKRGRKNT